MKKTLSVTPTKKELLWGLVYLALELLVLPSLLVLLLGLLPVTLSAGRMNALYFLINFAAVTFLFRRFLAASWRYSAERFGRVFFSALRGYMLYWAGSLAVSMLVLSIDPEFANVNDGSIAAMAAEDYGIIAFSTIVLVPITEELLFRGTLFGGLYHRSPLAAFVISSLAFCAVHITGYIGLYPAKTLLLCFIQYLPAGLALGWAYARSGSIFAPVLMHIFINATGILALR